MYFVITFLFLHTYCVYVLHLDLDQLTLLIKFSNLSYHECTKLAFATIIFASEKYIIFTLKNAQNFGTSSWLRHFYVRIQNTISLHVLIILEHFSTFCVSENICIENASPFLVRNLELSQYDTIL